MKFDDTRGRNEDHKVRVDDYDRRVKHDADFPDEPKQVLEGEVTPVVLPPRTGRYMMHCHNLVHEDHDMMVQFEVQPRDGSDDPVASDPWSPGREDKDPDTGVLDNPLSEKDC
jgi:hypothetical protein